MGSDSVSSAGPPWEGVRIWHQLLMEFAAGGLAALAGTLFNWNVMGNTGNVNSAY